MSLWYILFGFSFYILGVCDNHIGFHYIPVAYILNKPYTNPNKKKLKPRNSSSWPANSSFHFLSEVMQWEFFFFSFKELPPSWHSSQAHTLQFVSSLTRCHSSALQPSHCIIWVALPSEFPLSTPVLFVCLILVRTLWEAEKSVNRDVWSWHSQEDVLSCWVTPWEMQTGPGRHWERRVGLMVSDCGEEVMMMPFLVHVFTDLHVGVCENQGCLV